MSARTQRRHATIVAWRTNDTGIAGSVSVRCPFCRGVHQHSLRGTTDFAGPWCGTPGVFYQLIWPSGDRPSPA
jgi:hypothetical protein